VLWIPFDHRPTLWGLRISKAALLAAEYRRQAREAAARMCERLS
jgi:hypothetical protein